jgi:hypothetical protein
MRFFNPRLIEDIWVWFRDVTFFLNRWFNTNSTTSALQLGSDYANGNYTEIEADGTIVAYGSATTWDDQLPSSVTVNATGPNAPAFTAFNGNLKALEFIGTGPALKEIHLGFQFSHSMKLNTDIVIHLHIHIPDDVTGGVIKFYCEHTWANVSRTGVITPTTISGTVTRAANAGINNNAILAFSTRTPGANEGGISSVLMCRVYRDPTDVGDTFGASTWLLSTDVHYEKDTNGSRTTTVK